MCTLAGINTCQIYWRADDTVEYFIIKFPNEDLMRKWEVAIAEQRRLFGERNSRSVTSETEFKYMQDADIENPYKEDELDDEDSFNYPESAMSRNASSTSLRSRSTTGESIPPGISLRNGKQHVPLTLRTQHLYSAVSPQERFGNGNSYFSPGADSPVSYSSRTSSSSGIMPLHSRQSGPLNGYMEDSNRNTAPAAAYARQNGRDSGNGYNPVDPRNGRYPAPHHQAALSNRMRSASSPDVHTLNTNIRSAGLNGAPPIPSVPSHLSNSIVNRSQNNSPIYSTGSRASNDTAHLIRTHTMSPPVMSPTSSFGGDNSTPKLLVKVKVPSEQSAITLQVAVDVEFQTLRDRIDAKLTRFTQQSLANGSLKLKYLYDDEFVTIQTDEDVQTAFETWHDQARDSTAPGQEIELYCHR
jgi:cell division control protein 24